MNEVKKLRQTHGWTQLELAEKCGVTLRTIQNWEAGKPMSNSQMKLLHSIANGESAQVLHVGDNSLVNSNNNRVKPSVDAVVEQMMSELSELRKALTDALIVNQKHTDRLLTIIENEQRRWNNGERNN